ncbi:hypothetical protein FQA39_LY16767 [Lamprigera yunnana]|nr:hypothetical protein FQA39_LY16767 [Lamprigera yunnana]
MCSSTLILITTFTSVFVWYVYSCFKKRMKYWEDRGVFSVEANFPFGNAKDLVFQKVSISDTVQKLYETMKLRSIPYGGYYFFTEPIFVPADSKLIKRILISDFEYFSDRSFHSHESDPLSIHLFALKGEPWKRLRNLLSPAFTPSKLKMMLPLMMESVNNFVDVVKQQIETDETIDIFEIASKLTTDITISTFFGLQPNTLKDDSKEFQEISQKFFSESLRDAIVRTLSIINPEILTFFKIRSVHKSIADFFIKMTKDIISYREDNNVVRQDLMHLLLQIRNNVIIDDNEIGFVRNSTVNEEKTLTIEEVAAQCFIFLLAGNESTTTLISFCFYELGLNQDFQERARKEVQAVFEESNGEITLEGVQKLQFMDKCLKEALRKYPPAPVHLRECTKNYDVPNTQLTIEKGTRVFISVAGIHHDSDNYKDPDVFDPERFSSNTKPCVWTPFGDGPRACIAPQIASLMVKLAVSLFLLNFKFTVSPKTGSTVIFKKTTFVLRPKDGIWLSIKKI